MLTKYQVQLFNSKQGTFSVISKTAHATLDRAKEFADEYTRHRADITKKNRMYQFAIVMIDSENIHTLVDLMTCAAQPRQNMCNR